MDRNRSNLLIFIARLIEMSMGIIIFIFALVVQTQSYDGGSLVIVVTVMGGGIAIFGSLGLFAIKRHPDDIRDTRLYLLVLYVDCWAVAMCTAAAVLSIISATYWYGLSVMAGPAICSFVAMGAIVPLIVRTVRLWWSRDLHGMPPEEPVHMKPYATSYFASPSIRPTQDLEAGMPPDAQKNIEEIISKAADEIRSISITSSRPWSLAETTNATLYPNIMSAGATVRSMPAPSYTTKPKVGGETVT